MSTFIAEVRMRFDATDLPAAEEAADRIIDALGRSRPDVTLYVDRVRYINGEGSEASAKPA